MSIGIERVNGGILNGQTAEGALTFLKITGPAAAFDGSFSQDESRGAPDSAAELVYRVLSNFATPVIFHVVSRTEIHCAVAYGALEANASSDTVATKAQALLQDLGNAVAVRRYGDNTAVIGNSNELEDATVNFSSATVVIADFELA